MLPVSGEKESRREVVATECFVFHQIAYDTDAREREQRVGTARSGEEGRG